MRSWRRLDWWRDKRETAKIVQIGELVCAIRARMVAPEIYGESIPRCWQARQRIHQLQIIPGRDALDRRGNVGVRSRRERDLALRELRGGSRPLNDGNRRASANDARGRKTRCRNIASRRIEGPKARRGIKIPGRIVIEDNEVGRDRDVRRRSSDLIDRRYAPVKHRHAADDGAAEAAFEKYPIALNDRAVHPAARHDDVCYQ